MRPIAAVVVASSTRNSAALIGYVLNDKKDQRGERYVVATGVNGALVGQAEAQFRDVRKKHGKDRAGQYVQAYHVIQAFAKDGPGALDPDNPDDWLKAHELGRALAKLKAPGREAIVVTQRDGKTGCLHNHIVINSVERATGRSYNSAWVTHSRLVQEHDALLAEHGYVQRDDLRQAASDSKERYERGEAAVVRGTGERSNRELRDYAKWLEWDSQRAVAADLGEQFNTVEPFSQDVLTGRVQDAINDTSVTDWDTFVEAGARHGVRISKRGKKNTIRYGMVRTQGTTTVEPTSHQTRRDETLGAQFTLEALEQKWAQQAAAQQHHSATVAQPTIARTTPVPDKSEKTTPDAAAAGMVGTDDLTEKSTSYAAAPDMPAPASTPLPQATKKADPFADLHAEMDAYLNATANETRRRLGLGKTLEQLDAEKAAEAAQAAPEPVAVTEVREQVSEPVEREESTSSASATDMPTAAASAPLPPPADRPYRSRLWEFESDTPSVRDRAHRLAAYEEIAVPLLEAGERLDNCVLTSIGVRGSVMKKLGPFMHSDFRKQLELRAKKLALAQQFHESNMQPAAERLRAQAAAGVYETVAVENKPKKVRLSAPQERQVEDDEMSL